jgi:hypothetical protein
MMRKLYQEMVLKQADIKVEAPVQIKGLSRKKEAEASPVS